MASVDSYKWVGSKSFKSAKGNQVYLIYLARKQVDGAYEAIDVFTTEDVFMQAIGLGLKVGENCRPSFEWGNHLQAISRV